MQRLRREVRHDAREERRLQQSREPMFDRAPVGGEQVAFVILDMDRR